MKHRIFLLIGMLMYTLGLLQNAQAQSTPSMYLFDPNPETTREDPLAL